MEEGDVTVFSASDGSVVTVRPGRKPSSRLDFVVRYRQAGRRRRTPKHIHTVVDLYLKRCREPALTDQLVDEIIAYTREVQPVAKFPPVEPPLFQSQVELVASKYAGLSGQGEYPVDFLIAVSMLLMLQEKTNYPSHPLRLNVFEAFRSGKDIFTVVSTATFRGRSK